MGGDGMLAARLRSWGSAAPLLVLMRRLGTPIYGAMAAAGGAFLMATWAPFAFWSHSRLETASVAMIMTLGGLLLAGPDREVPLAAGLTLALLPWLRPEGPIPALVLAFASEGLGLLTFGRRREAVRRLLQIAVPPHPPASVGPTGFSPHRWRRQPTRGRGLVHIRGLPDKTSARTYVADHDCPVGRASARQSVGGMVDRQFDGSFAKAISQFGGSTSTLPRVARPTRR